MIEARKVQKLGQTSLIITLPKKWVNAVNLKPGDIVFISIEDDKILKVTPKKLEVEAIRPTYIIDADRCTSPGMLERVITACYLQGYDKIMIKTKKDRLSADHMTEIRNSIARHMGLSILEQKPKEVILQCFIDPTKFPIDGLIKRLYGLIISMAEFLVQALDKDEKEMLEEVKHLEEEVDRFYWLLVRQLFLAQRSKNVAKQINIREPLHLLGNRVVVKVLEDAGDALNYVAEIMLGLWDMEEARKRFKKFKDLIGEIPRVADKSMTALINLDVKMANEVINEVRDLISTVEALDKMLGRGEPWRVAEALTLSRILAALDKFNVIAEITINRAVEEPSELVMFKEEGKR